MSIERDYPLLPEDDDGVDVDEDLASAVASVLQEPAPVPGEAPDPYGATWDLNFETHRFRRQGLAPARLTGRASLVVWCEMALRTARYAHSAFTDDFGMERPEDMLGHVDVGEFIGDYEQRLREALLVHDRIADVTNFAADYDPDQGVFTIHTFEIVTDDAQNILVGPLRLEVGA